MIDSNNQPNGMLVQKKAENTISEFNNIKMHETNQNGKIKKPVLKSIAGKNKTKTKKTSEKNNQTNYTVEEHDGHVVIDINKKKKVGKKAKVDKKRNFDYIQVVDNLKKTPGKYKFFK